jgi:hypothetical protein
MADMSILEFIVYGFLAYSGILMLIVSAFKEDGTASRSQTGVKVVWLLPCIFAAVLLAGAGQDITFETVNTVNTITNNVTSTVDFTEDVTTETKITLVQPVWGMVHMLLFFVMLLYVIIQILIMLTKHD